MLAVIFLTGFLLGIVVTTVTIFAYTAAIEMREEEQRQIREEKRRQAEMRRRQSIPQREEEQDPIEEKIIEATEEAVQMREKEGRNKR